MFYCAARGRAVAIQYVASSETILIYMLIRVTLLALGNNLQDFSVSYLGQIIFLLVSILSKHFCIYSLNKTYF